MSDGSGRSAEEREAARLERERKRAARSGKPKASTPSPTRASPATPSPAPRSSSQWIPAPRSSSQRSPAPRSPAPPSARIPEPAAVSSSPAGRSFSPERELARESDPRLGPDRAQPGGQPGDGRDDTGSNETAEHELELPSGTRRVSMRDKPPVPPPARKARKARRQRRPGGPRKSRRQRLPGEPRRRYSWLGRIVSLVALALAGGLIWFLIQLFQPFGTSPHGRVTVSISPRSTSSKIGDLLQRDGVISSSFFFKLRATLAGDRSDLLPGTYHLQLGMSYGAVLHALTTPPKAAKVSELTVTPGQRRKDISAHLHAQHVAGSYLVATRSTKLLNFRALRLRHRPPTLEGFLFPDTYQLVDPVRVSALVADQLQNFKKEFAKVNLGYARRKHLTPYDVLKIASLIEAETPTVHDRPLVASVIYNRLADGMMLGLDSTTQYATGNFTRPLTVSQLHSSSPYNTRTHVGLPPTPIDNPGLASMQAAAHPARTNYLYFFGKPCGRGSVFANNYTQFLALGRRYQRKHC